MNWKLKTFKMVKRRKNKMLVMDFISLIPTSFLEISRWQTGSILNGVKGASSVPSSMASSSSTSSTHTDNSRVTNIGTINLQNPAGSASVNPSMARGMDWNTLLTQQNAGLMP